MAWWPGRRSIGAVALGGLAILGATATGLAFSIARDGRQRQDSQVLAQASERVSLRLRSSLSALRGVSALAVDGTVDALEFSVFGSATRRDSVYAALAYSDVVTSAERSDWQARTGYEIRDTDGQGGFPPASIRDRYVPVRLVDPMTEASRAVLGFDIASDPVRADAERQASGSLDPVLVGPIRLAGNGRPGLYAIQAVRDTNGTVIGMVSSGITASTLIDDLQDIPGISTGRVTLTVDGVTVIDGGETGPKRAFAVGGRTVELTARSDDHPRWALLPIVVLSGTIALGAAAASVGVRDRRDRRREQTAADRQVRLAALTDDLAQAHDVRSVVAAAAATMRSVLGADHSNVGLLDVTDPSKLLVVHDGAIDAELGARFAAQAVDTTLPLTDCVRLAQPIVVENRDAYVRRYPHVIDDIDRAGIQAVVCVPLRASPSDAAIGVIGFAWRRPLASGEEAPIVRAAARVAEVVGRALERALGREAVELGMQRLREFTADLATAANPADVEAAVSEQLPTLFRVPAVTIDSSGLHPTSPTGRWYPVYDDATMQAGLVVQTDHPSQWTPAHEDLMATVAGLVQNAWRRAREHEQEKSVLLRLQATLLMPPPAPRDVAVDVRYVAALDSVGLGGDWYSIIEREDATFLVVGDTAGHGPEAVALMAEVKTVLRHVLDRGATLEEAAVEADASLRRRRGYASAVLVEVPRHEPVLRYLNAGHPCPLLRTAHGVHSLDDTHRPWLGMATDTLAPSTHGFAPGDLLLLYTDGLVERRGRSIDEGIAAVAQALAVTPRERLFDTLLAARAARTDGGYVDDDVALLSAERMPPA